MNWKFRNVCVYIIIWWCCICCACCFKLTLRQECSYSEFSGLYSVWMRENTDQKNSDSGHFLRSFNWRFSSKLIFFFFFFSWRYWAPAFKVRNFRTARISWIFEHIAKGNCRAYDFFFWRVFFSDISCLKICFIQCEFFIGVFGLSARQCSI